MVERPALHAILSRLLTGRRLATLFDTTRTVAVCWHAVRGVVCCNAAPRFGRGGIGMPGGRAANYIPRFSLEGLGPGGIMSGGGISVPSWRSVDMCVVFALTNGCVIRWNKRYCCVGSMYHVGRT